jgi:hypothetical protein
MGSSLEERRDEKATRPCLLKTKSRVSAPFASATNTPSRSFELRISLFASRNEETKGKALQSARLPFVRPQLSFAVSVTIALHGFAFFLFLPSTELVSRA